MGLPQPTDVEACAARSWSSAHAQHALLFLAGITSSLRQVAKESQVAWHAWQRGRREREAARFESIASELEILSGDLVRAMREHPVDVPGAVLPQRLCLLLACETEAQLAQTLAVPISIVLAGRSRMYALAERMVSTGRVENEAGAPGLTHG